MEIIQNDNMKKWFDVFKKMPYASEVMIYDGSTCNTIDPDDTGLIFKGKLQDLNYMDLLELENYTFGHIEAREGKLFLLGYEHLAEAF